MNLPTEKTSMNYNKNTIKRASLKAYMTPSYGIQLQQTGETF